MQSLSQEVWRHDPALVNTDASAGELAWSWGSEVDIPGLDYRHRVWLENSSVAAWAYIAPPQMITVTADRKEMSDASLNWQIQQEVRIALVDRGEFHVLGAEGHQDRPLLLLNVPDRRICLFMRSARRRLHLLVEDRSGKSG